MTLYIYVEDREQLEELVAEALVVGSAQAEFVLAGVAASAIGAIGKWGGPLRVIHWAASPPGGRLRPI
ncbi:MAG: hypothetical protein ACSLE6_10915 [Mycobacterium sp.]